MNRQELPIDRIAPMNFRQVNHLAELERYSKEQFWHKEDYERHLMEDYCGGFVAIEGSSIVGLICYECFPNDGSTLIWNLVVHPRFRQQGLGRNLLSTVENSARQISQRIKVNVRETNLTAHIFLSRSGYVAWGISEGYFQDHVLNNVKVENAYCFHKIVSRSESFSINKLTHTDRFGNAIHVC